MLDHYLLGDAERISPEAPVPIVAVESEAFMPGGAANVAVTLQVAGIHARLIGTIGDDTAGRTLVDTLTAHNIGTDQLVTVAQRQTTSKTRIVARGQQIVRIDREVTQPLPGPIRDAVLSAAHAAVDAADALLLEDYDKGTIDAAMAADLVAAARARKIPVVVDPKQRNFFAYAGATVFKPNRRELAAAFITHGIDADADLDDARRRLGCEHLLVTLGADGMALASANAPIRRAPSLAREVFDVSGAGDVVAAWITLVLAAQGSIDEAAWLANVAASLAVGKRGTTSVAPREVLETLASIGG
jgi:D-beta-D-heptose 7-phosphate kinase/D-beta-D-heptose 1-phosphate adenosyltransferase